MKHNNPVTVQKKKSKQLSNLLHSHKAAFHNLLLVMPPDKKMVSLRAPISQLEGQGDLEGEKAPLNLIFLKGTSAIKYTVSERRKKNPKNN